MIRIKKQNVLYDCRDVFQMSNFLTVYWRGVFRNPIKSLLWSVFTKIVNNF